jgi:hypothetical protein
VKRIWYVTVHQKKFASHIIRRNENIIVSNAVDMVIQKKIATLREDVSYVDLSGYGDNGERSLKNENCNIFIDY